MSDKICVFCGAKATTRDHIPPKGIFPRPLPPNAKLITVPACTTCNGSASEDDEIFRNYISQTVSADSDFRTTEEQNKLKGQAKRGIERSPKKDIQNKNPALIVNENKIIERTEAKAEFKVTERVIKKIVRGLYFYHFKSIFPIGKKIEIIILNPLRKGLWCKLQFKSSNICGEDVFHYQYGRLDLDLHVSIWVFDFYNNKKIGAITDPEKLEELKKISSHSGL